MRLNCLSFTINHEIEYQLTDRPSIHESQDVTRILDNKFSMKCKSVSPPRDNKKLLVFGQKPIKEPTNSDFDLTERRLRSNHMAPKKIESTNLLQESKENKVVQNNFGFGKLEDYRTTVKAPSEEPQHKFASILNEKAYLEKQNNELTVQVKLLRDEIAGLNKRMQGTSSLQSNEKKTLTTADLRVF